MDMPSTDERVSAGDIFEAAVEEAEKTIDAGVASGEAQTPVGTVSEPLAAESVNGRARLDTQSAARTAAAACERQSVTRSAGIVSLAVMGSRLLGLVREVVFAAYFGAGFLKDAFDVAFRIPNLLRDLFAEGALSAAFVKTFTDYTENKSEEEAWALASMVMNALAVVLSLITIIGIIFSPQIVSVIADGFSPEKARLATTLTRLMFPFILLVALAAVAMGVLNTKKQFGIPASASTLFNVGSIVGGLAFAFWFSGGGWTSPSDPTAMPDARAQWAIMGMAVGTLIGGALQFLIQVPSLRRVGFRFRPLLSFTDTGVRRVMRLMGPALIGTAAVQVNVLVSSYFASSINGGVASLGYAFRLMQLPIGIFGVAIGTATLPTISKFAARKDIPNFRSTLSSSINLVFLLTIPSACGLVVLGRPIIALIYQRGAFTTTSTEMAAIALVCYAVGLTGYAAIKVLSPAFYALDDARTPMIISLTSIAVNWIACYFLKDWFSTFGVTPETPNGYGHAGLALSTSCVALVNFLALAYFMRRKIKRLEGRRILSSFVRIAVASLALSAASHFTYRWLLALLGTQALSARLIETFVPILFGGAVFLAAARLLRVEELSQAQQAFMGRFRPRRK
ncbi:MAG: murein biosynthesis integral membrane protein MurJ [Pyrinomonadaceae bacterium]|nr:murein biosynthesis integral membrane protein MurJ [Pyrinomonadaceae bacterium]